MGTRSQPATGAGDPGLREAGGQRLRVCVLECVTVRGPGKSPVPIGAMQQKILLTLLVAAGERAVPVDRIAEELWGDSRPPRWQAGIRTLANSLRRVAADRDFIHWSGRGYRLHRYPGTVESDVDDMLAATEEAGAALRAGRYSQAERAARRALSYYGSGPWTTDYWYWGELAADAYFVLGRSLLAQDNYLRCLLELSRAPEELDGHDGVRACLRRARRAVSTPEALPANW